MTGRVEQFTGKVRDRLNEIMPDLAACEVIAGRFNLEQLEGRSFRAPAAFVGVLKSPVDLMPDGRVSLKANCAVFLVTEGREDKRDAAAWTMAEAVIAILGSTAHWGIAGIGLTEKVEVEPVVSATIARKGVTLIAVTWSNEIRRIGDNIFAEDGTLYGQLYVNDALAVDEANTP